MIENDVCVVNRRMILFAKRFRSKALSAASLSPIELVGGRRIAFDFLPTPCDTASKGGQGGLAIFIKSVC
jgi:hypothetical protein